MKRLRIRFILYNMLVIGCVAALLLLWAELGKTSHGSADEHNFLHSAIYVIVLVFLSSAIISKFALRPVEKAWKKQLDFTADASHELRTPLAVIQTNLEVLQDNPEATIASQEKWLQNIAYESNRMNKLVADLLLLSRADTNHTQLNLEPFSLSDLIQTTASAFSALAEPLGIKIYTILPEEDTCLFTGDADRIAQLLSLLVDNAIKYMNRPGRIEMVLITKNNGYSITVADNGLGIPKENLEHIFERFYRCDKARSRSMDGNGLGLSIAQWIVESHYGKIRVTSEENQGTSFYIFLPNHK